jgi:hypothetical protein
MLLIPASSNPPACAEHLVEAEHDVDKVSVPLSQPPSDYSLDWDHV